MSVIVHRGRFTPDDRAERFYRYLPFDVPARAAGIRVSLEYPRDAGVIDLGCVGPEGFRGWSGGARDGFVISAGASTPGYRDGELEAGEWSALLGLHRVPHPIPYVVRAEALASAPEIETLATAAVVSRPPLRDLPAPCGMRWVAGDLHCHSVHSDGVNSPEQLAAMAVASGLDFLAITDHNTDTHHRDLPAIGARHGITLVPGQEITTARGHANAFGDIGWIDFRRPAARWQSDVDERGGLLSLNHPIADDCGWTHPLPRPPALAEVWHCSWRDHTHTGPLAWWRARGTEVVAVGGSDFHRPGDDAPLGQPTTWVCVPEADTGVESILDGLRSGRVAVSANPRGPVLLRVDGELVAVDADGCLLADLAGGRRMVRGDLARFPAEAGPFLLEDGNRTVMSLSNDGSTP
ncbi:MAG TPA: CehA/McbA family metallohydrolase [Stackebrandtia sp.]|uniref:CehA/McbA family metallohydrolase n=1 Tax=Stackebrandtia sp. TaxID=2023065 RepID=UPI002D45EA17|nr:CehA/McbA family metallohydrolase [Stackebrandtia sp.]HZE39622.1 CehA/McbA family metallohydrolase [Stackebrandtia sp.]